MKSNIYKKLELFFDNTMINIAKKMDYNEENIIILENNEEKLKNDYPDVYQNLLSCNHNKDYRSFMEYAQDLICSWIFEDYLIFNLKLFGIQIELSGNDKNRKILQNNSVSSASDYYIEYKGKKAFMELANDYTGYWKRTKKCDLRDDKYKNIQSKAINNEFSFLLGVDFVNNEFFIIDLLDRANVVTYSDYHRFYHKPAYTIHLSRIEYLDFSFENIAKKIMEFMN